MEYLNIDYLLAYIILVVIAMIIVGICAVAIELIKYIYNKIKDYIKEKTEEKKEDRQRRELIKITYEWKMRKLAEEKKNENNSKCEWFLPRWLQNVWNWTRNNSVLWLFVCKPHKGFYWN